MVNYFSSTPSSISGGYCGCSGLTGTTIEPFYEDKSYEYYSDAPATGNVSSVNHSASQTAAFDPLSTLFSSFFSNPASGSSSHLATPLLHGIAKQTGITPAQVHSLVQQAATEFNINPAELKENVAHFLSQFGINKQSVKSLLNIVAGQIGLKNRMGHPGTINPNTVNQILRKNNIPTVSKNNSSVLSQSPSHLPSHSNSSVGAHPPSTSVNQVFSEIVDQIMPTSQNVAPVVPQNNGSKQPLVVSKNGVLTTPTGSNVAVNHSGVLTNKSNGKPVTTNQQPVVVDHKNHLVNSQSGQTVTVPVINKFVNNQAVNNQAAGTLNTTYNKAAFNQAFGKTIPNQVWNSYTKYASENPSINPYAVDPVGLKQTINTYLAGFANESPDPVVNQSSIQQPNQPTTNSFYNYGYYN
jgi:hypothetical protein